MIPKHRMPFLMSHEEKFNAIQLYFSKMLGSYDAGVDAMDLLFSDQLTHDRLIKTAFFKDEEGITFAQGFINGLYHAYLYMAQQGREEAMSKKGASETEVFYMKHSPKFEQHPLVKKCLKRWKQYRHLLSK